MDASAAGSMSVALSDADLELYEIFAPCTPLFDDKMVDFRDPKLELVQEARRKGVTRETLVGKPRLNSDMQLILWEEPVKAVVPETTPVKRLKPNPASEEMQLIPWQEPIKAVPLASMAPTRKRATGGNFHLPPGWTEYETVRTGGKTKGRKDKTYVDPSGKRHRSRQEVKRALGISDQRRLNWRHT